MIAGSGLRAPGSGGGWVGECTNKSCQFDAINSIWVGDAAATAAAAAVATSACFSFFVLGRGYVTRRRGEEGHDTEWWKWYTHPIAQSLYRLLFCNGRSAVVKTGDDDGSVVVAPAAAAAAAIVADGSLPMNWFFQRTNRPKYTNIPFLGFFLRLFLFTECQHTLWILHTDRWRRCNWLFLFLPLIIFRWLVCELPSSSSTLVGERRRKWSEEESSSFWLIESMALYVHQEEEVDDDDDDEDEDGKQSIASAWLF